jgi:hypothetical protein
MDQMTDPTPLNLQPAIDLLSKTGSMTSEYQQAKAAGTTGKIAFWIGLLGTIAGTVAAIAGITNPIGAAAGAVVMITGAVVQAISSNGYSAARADTKAAAATMVAASVIPPTPVVNPNP